MYPQKHYVFVNRDRARLADPAILQSRAFEGAQVKYVWRELEPSKGEYDFKAVREDLALLAAHGKRLFIQIQDVSFDVRYKGVPRYLVTEAEFHGGVAMQYVEKGRRRVADGWVARRWDPAVRARFHALLNALGAEFDGKIEGVNLAETAVGFEQGDALPAGFSFASYRDGIIANMAALKKAFPKSVTMQYANFMPGEWLPDSDKGYLRGVYAAAQRLGVGVGGPDLLPHRRGQLDHSYPLIAHSAGVVPTGMAVQEGNYGQERATVGELHRFARDTLKADYVFWCTEAPFFSRDVRPYLEGLRR